MNKFIAKLLIIIAAFVVFVLFWHYDLAQYLNLEYIKANQTLFSNYYAENQWQTALIFFLVYVVVTAVSLPGGATILTLVGGAAFGFVTGLVIVSFASTVGATLAFLSSRFLFRDYAHSKFGGFLDVVNKGIEKEGAFYLFSLRLIPAFPFFVINLVMGLTSIKATTFFLVSQLGMLAGTAVYVNAGLQLSELDTLQEVLSFKIVGSFILLGVFPLIVKKTMIRFQKQDNDAII